MRNRRSSRKTQRKIPAQIITITIDAYIRSLIDYLPLNFPQAGADIDEELVKGIAAGICKVNIDTRIRMAFTNTIRNFLIEHPKEIDPRKALKPAFAAAKEVIKGRIKVLGSAGKA